MDAINHTLKRRRALLLHESAGREEIGGRSRQRQWPRQWPRSRYTGDDRNNPLSASGFGIVCGPPLPVPH